jgi:ankyrin repeat protein
MGAALYANDEVFRSLVIETLECKAHAQSKLLWWLEDEAQSISAQGVYGSATTDRASSLRAAHRGRIAFLEGSLPLQLQRRSAVVRPCSRTKATTVVRPESPWWAEDRARAALELCKLKGLVRESVEETNELGETVFVRAANEGENMRVLELLVEARADVNARNAQDKGATALFYAAKRGDVERIQQLHGLGAGLEPVVNGTQTPLIIAAGQGLTEAVQALVKLRADVAAMPVYGITALREAARGGHRETVRVLQQLGAER